MPSKEYMTKTQETAIIEPAFELIREIKNPMVFAVDQCHEIFPDPEKVFAVNEKGEFIKSKIKTEEEMLSRRLFRHRKAIAALLIVSGGFLFLMLFQESHMADNLFNWAWTEFWKLFGNYLGKTFGGLFGGFAK